MTFVDRDQHTIPATFIGVELKHWARGLLSGPMSSGLEPIAQFQLRTTKMGWCLTDITDVIVSLVDDRFGLEVVRGEITRIDPNRLVMDAESLTNFLTAWRHHNPDVT